MRSQLRNEETLHLSRPQAGLCMNIDQMFAVGSGYKARSENMLDNMLDVPKPLQQTL